VTVVKVAVTGGSGFVGTRLIRRLLDSGHEVLNLDPKQSRQHGAHTRICDIRDPDGLRTSLAGDAVIHLAAVHRDDVRPLDLYYETNVEGTRNLCRAMEEKGISRIVFASSVAVYGFAAPGAGEDAAINPFNEYGRSKYQAEEVLRSWYEADPENRSLTIVRPTVICGEGNRGNVFNLFRQMHSGLFLMIGNGRNIKSLAYVENVAAFFEFALAFGPGHRVINYVDKPDMDMNTLVGTVRKTLHGRNGAPLRLPHLAGICLGAACDVASKVTKRPLPLSLIRVRKFVATTQFSSAAHDLAGFTAPVALDRAISRTLEYEFLDPPDDIEVFYTE
jgi:GlcNAc-P-P-Und epimerase